MSITCIDVNEEHFILIIVVSSYINPKHVYGSATILAGRGLWLYINLFGCLCGYPEHPPQHHSEAVCTNLNVVGHEFYCNFCRQIHIQVVADIY